MAILAVLSEAYFASKNRVTFRMYRLNTPGRMNTIHILFLECSQWFFQVVLDIPPGNTAERMTSPILLTQEEMKW